MKEGFQFIRQREGLEPLVVLAFLMTLLGFSMVGFLPVFVQEVFKQGPEDVSIAAGLFGRRGGDGRIDRGGGCARPKRQGRAVAADHDRAGRADRELRAVALAAACPAC